MKTKRKNDGIAQERAHRVRSLREALHYSRKKFCITYGEFGVTLSTLQSWEAVRWNGLTERGAQILSTVFLEEGLKVTVEWLMFGIGENPLEKAIALKLEKRIAQISKTDNIARELKLFRQLNEESIDAIITDNALAPCLLPGDHVAGCRYFDNDIDKAIGFPCILQTLSGDILIRQLKSGSDSGLYDLICTNATTNIRPQQDVKLFSAAPIIWIRKKP